MNEKSFIYLKNVKEKVIKKGDILYVAEKNNELNFLNVKGEAVHLATDVDVEVNTFFVVVNMKNNAATLEIRNMFKLEKKDISLEKTKKKYVNIELNGQAVMINQQTYEKSLLSGISDKSLLERKKLKGLIQEENETYYTIELIGFVDFNRKSSFSLLESTVSIDDLVAKTEVVGAVTDNILTTSLKYYKSMTSVKKIPIIGLRLTVKTKKYKNSEYHGTELVLIAKNYQGYRNLIRISSAAYETIEDDIAYVDLSLIEKYASNTFAIIPQEKSELAFRMSEMQKQQFPMNDELGHKEAVQTYIGQLKNIFNENLYIEVAKRNEQISDLYTAQMENLARQLRIKVIASSASHILNKDDTSIHEIVDAMKHKTTLDDMTRTIYEGDYHVRSHQEMHRDWQNKEHYLINTLDLLDEIDFELKTDEIYMPTFKNEENKDENTLFKEWCEKGFRKKFKDTVMIEDEEYKERLNFEVATILNMGFPGYFLITSDLVRWAKDKGILVAPGRGSACGSMVAYVLEITDIDPIQHGLLFERFLNPDRISMPDIDLDFDDTRREEVVQYVKEKYGEKAVSNIITFGTLSARSVVRSVSKSMDKSFAFGSKIANLIPAKPGITIKSALKDSPELKELYETDSEIREVMDYSIKLESLPRNMSIHACGVLIAPSDVQDYIPQVKLYDEKLKEYKYVTQVTMGECEEFGLLKMDFLGLRTMGVVSKTLEIINKKYKLNLRFEDIPINDPEVYDFISRGETAGVFQLESEGMTKFMTKLFQDVHKLKLEATDKVSLGNQLFERLVAGISLYRPGPMDEIPNYLKYMLDESLIQYETPELEPILSNTYSIIVYQEQVMFIVRELANFTKGEADTIRKAMGKKVISILEEYKQKFINGCNSNGINEEIANNLWDKMEKFARYAFNKSHAVGYGVISARTAWLSYYYEKEYMAANINSYVGKNHDKVKKALSDIKQKKIKILPPDVNKSEIEFIATEDSIQFGLKSLKGLGKISESLVEERKTNGEYVSYQDLVKRLSVNKGINKTGLEALIYTGALDSIEYTRREKIENLARILKVAKEDAESLRSGQTSLFDFDDFKEIEEIKIKELGEYDEHVKLEKEYEFANMYITGHPMDMYEKDLAVSAVQKISSLWEYDNENEDEDYNMDIKEGENYELAGIIKNFKVVYTKKNQDAMAIFTLEDATSSINMVIFANEFEEYKYLLQENAIVIVKGVYAESEDFGPQIIVSAVDEISNLALSGEKNILRIEIKTKDEQDRLLKMIEQYGEVGETLIVLQVNQKSYPLHKNRVKVSIPFFNKLKESFLNRVTYS